MTGNFISAVLLSLQLETWFLLFCWKFAGKFLLFESSNIFSNGDTILDFMSLCLFEFTFVELLSGVCAVFSGIREIFSFMILLTLLPHLRFQRSSISFYLQLIGDFFTIFTSSLLGVYFAWSVIFLRIKMLLVSLNRISDSFLAGDGDLSCFSFHCR